MNSSAEDRANSKKKPPGTTAPVFGLAGAGRTLPLLRRVVGDVLRQRQELARLHPEQERLDRQRRALPWPDRARRYQLRDEIAALEAQLRLTLQELKGLGVTLLDAATGRVGFLTAVNGHRAFFSWQPDEDGIHYWHFEGETVRRPIPPHWAQGADVRLLGKD
jgi:hypothetical protein